jgi:hypothetical protein
VQRMRGTLQGHWQEVDLPELPVRRCESGMSFSLGDEIALLQGKESFLLVARAGSRFCLCIESSTGEYCQGVDPTDLIVVSAPEGGEVEPGIMLIELVRKYHLPLIVLPKDHPGSKRLSYVVSVGPEIHADCSIRRGTHPEQHVICANDELHGLTIATSAEGFEVSSIPDGVTLKRLQFQMKAVFS